MSTLTLLRSPLVHFFALGGCLFLLYSALDRGTAEPPPDTIRLGREEATRLVGEFQAVRGRPPTATELTALMRGWAMEEAAVREALALGLDRGDPVIRQRLALKMQLLAESGASALVPDDATLESFLRDHPESFEEPGRIAFSQILLAPGTGADLAAIRAALGAGADPGKFGRPSLLPPAMPATPVAAIDGIFGPGFAASIETLPTGHWAGPVESSQGLHLVRVTDRSPAVVPRLKEVRARVEAEWRRNQARQMREAYGALLLGRYEVDLPAADEVLGR